MVVVTGVASTAFVTGAPVANVDKHDDRTRMSIATKHPAIVGHFDFDGISKAHDADYFDEDPPVFGLATSGTNVNSHVGDGSQVIPFTMPVKTCGPGQMAQTNGATIRLGEMVQFEWRNSVSRPPNKFAVPPSVTPKTFRDKGGWRTANPIKQNPLRSTFKKKFRMTVTDIAALSTGRNRDEELRTQLQNQYVAFEKKYAKEINPRNPRARRTTNSAWVTRVGYWNDSTPRIAPLPDGSGGFEYTYKPTATQFNGGAVYGTRTLIVERTVSRPDEAHFNYRAKHGAWRSLGVARATPSPVVVHRSSLPYTETENMFEDLASYV